MEDMEIFHHIDQWTPGTSVLPSIPNEEQIGSVQKQFSGTTTKQKLQADQSTGTFSELGLDKQKKSLQTKVLPGDVGGNLNTTVLPPELLNDILSLREDYPEEDGIVDLGRKADRIHGQRKQNKGSHQSETHQKTFSEAIAKFKTFDSAVDNVFEGVVFHDDNSKDFSVRKEKSCQGSDKIPLEEGSNDVSVLELSRKSSIAKGCAFNDKGNASFPEGSASFSEGSASFPEGSASPGKFSIGELQSPAKRAVNEILEKHFALKGKILCPLDLQGTSGYTGITNTISVSELRQAAQYHGCTNNILFFSNHDPPNTNEPHTQSNSSGIGETFGQWKLAEPDGLGNLAKQGHRLHIPTYPPQKLPSDIPNLSNVKMPRTLPLEKALSQSPIMLSQDGASQSYSGGSVSVLANWSMPISGKDLPGAIQNICTQSSLDIPAQSEPPDLTHYTCSTELKHALQMKFQPFKHYGQAGPNNLVNGGAACGQRHHPYTKHESASTKQFQMTLPNLPEFMESISK